MGHKKCLTQIGKSCFFLFQPVNFEVVFNAFNVLQKSKFGSTMYGFSAVNINSCKCLCKTNEEMEE